MSTFLTFASDVCGENKLMKNHRFFVKIASVSAAFALALVTLSPICSADELPDAELLAAYIEGGPADELYGMIAVGATIINRIRSDDFTDSLSSNASSLGIFPSPSPSDMALYASRLALSGEDPTHGAVRIIRGGAGGENVTLVTCGLSFSR